MEISRGKSTIRSSKSINNFLFRRNGVQCKTANRERGRAAMGMTYRYHTYFLVIPIEHGTADGSQACTFAPSSPVISRRSPYAGGLASSAPFLSLLLTACISRRSWRAQVASPGTKPTAEQQRHPATVSAANGGKSTGMPHI